MGENDSNMIFDKNFYIAAYQINKEEYEQGRSSIQKCYEEIDKTLSGITLNYQRAEQDII